MSDTPDFIVRPVSVGAAQEYVEGLFGGPITESESVYTIDTTPYTAITQNNPDRVGLTIINLGSNDLFIALDINVSTSRGVYLAKNGGTASITVVDDQMLPTRAWYAISSIGSTTVYVLEIFRFALTYQIV